MLKMLGLQEQPLIPEDRSSRLGHRCNSSFGEPGPEFGPTRMTSRSGALGSRTGRRTPLVFRSGTITGIYLPKET